MDSILAWALGSDTLPIMLASDLRGPGSILICEVPAPIAEEGDLLLRLASAGICGSDLTSVRTGRVTLGMPTLPGASGHELVGEVVDSRADGHRAGELVLALPPRDNGFAEYVAVPASACLPVPEGLAPDAAVLAQQLGTVVHSLRVTGSLLDRSIAIVGQGPAGLAFVALALAMGARRVIAVEPRAARRAAGLRLGADAVIDPATTDPAEAVVELTGGGADLVIDAAGGPDSIELATRAARPFGAVLQFGLPDHATRFDHELAFRRQLTTYRAVYAQEETDLACFRLALAMLARGSFPARGLVSHRLPLRELPEALRLAGDPAGDALKVLLGP
jgi:L-iditol 2-dehydrogenase